jgi:dienelactone hydrolase/pimeloyl-ACP methyl ester carboxylesterase
MDAPVLNRCSRRQLLQLAGAQTLAAPIAYSWLTSHSDAAEEYKPLNRYPRMVHEWYVHIARAAERQKLGRLEELKTKADAEGYVEMVRRNIRSCFGPDPPRTPLNPRVTRVVKRDGYRIENLIFESRPGFPVTANLYVPEGRDEPMPGVVGTCGHSTNGKAEKAYQSFAQGLTKQGYVCLLYDPIGQGERLQYVNEDLSPRIGTGTREHLYAGNQQFLVGDFFGMWRAWDGIRALDYLLTRSEVDPNHVGVTGNSDGGTMTTWLCGVEPRWTMAAPSCFVTTFRRNLENELPADTEQCPPRAIFYGLDQDDFLAAMAPKPVIILAKERDYFDARGSEEAFVRLKRLYSLLGAEENIGLFIGPTTHGYSQENREAMYGWFNAVTKVSDGKTEPEITIEKDETLWCTPHGQVAELAGTRTVFRFTREKSRQLTKSRNKPDAIGLARMILDVLRLPRGLTKTPEYRIWRHLGSRGYPSPHAIAYAVETERQVYAHVYRLTKERWHSRPPRAGKRAILYVSHLSSDTELRDESLIRELIDAEPETPFFTCDVRGIGESQPDTCSPGSFHAPYGNDFFYASHGLMLDRPYLGQKTYDVVRVLDWLKSLGHNDIHLVGRGWGALAATFAAVLSDGVKQVTLKNSLISYGAIAESEDYAWPLATLPPNILANFDLPDCYAVLEAKQLRQIDPWGAMATIEPRTGELQPKSM